MKKTKWSLDGGDVWRAQPKIDEWVTRDGVIITIEEMTDAHLENTMRYLERKGVRSVLRAKALKRIPESAWTEEDCAAVAHAGLIDPPISETLIVKYQLMLEKKAQREARGAWNPFLPEPENPKRRMLRRP